jgi:hypothetical protein
MEKIIKQELLTALEIVKPGLGSNLLIEQISSFAFLDGRVITYNDEISISHPVEGINFSGAIKAEEMYKLLEKLTTEEVELEMKGNEIILKSYKSKAGFPIQAEIKLPIQEIEKATKWYVLPTNYLDQLLKCSYCCSTTNDQPILTAVFINHKEGFSMGCDRFRLMYAEFAGMELPAILIPATSIPIVYRISPVKMAVTENWVHFENNDNTIIHCRIMNDAYKDLKYLLNVEGTDLILPNNILKILERASILSEKEGDQEITIVTIEKGKLTVRSQSEKGWYEETTKIRYKNPEKPVITFSMNINFFKAILKEELTCIIGDRAIKFQGAGWAYVGMLRRM